MTENEVTENGPRKIRGGALVAEVDKDHLRSLFHLFVGKPDSTQKILNRHVLISRDAIEDLHSRVLEKLKTHHIEGLVASVDLTFEDKTTVQFGGWAEFNAFRWTTPKATKELRIRWHFLLNVQGYQIPQQHALTVKMSADVTPFEFLQAALSKHPDELDLTEFAFSPVVCRVDFISHLMSQELIGLVEEWNKGLPQPPGATGWLVWLRKRSTLLFRFIRYSTPLLAGFAAAAALGQVMKGQNSEAPITLSQMKELLSWVVYVAMAVYVAEKFATWLARVAHESLENSNRHTMFTVSNGDDIRARAFREKNNRLIWRFVCASGFSFALNVLAGILTAKYWPG